MKKSSGKLKTPACVAILIGGMFGSAIFSLSGLTILNAGPSSIISWFLAAPIMLIYGLLMAEMSSYYPKSGGVYVFPARAINGKKGSFWGWISCWCYILGNFAAIAFSAIYVGVYLSVVIPDCAGLQIPLALVALLFVLILNVVKITKTGVLNNVFVVILIVFMLVFVFVSITNSNFNVNNFVPFFSQGKAGEFGFISMIPIALMSYSAIVSVAFMANEVENPKKTIPRASIISIVILVVMYCLILFATLGLVTSDFLSSNPQMQMIPIFAACTKMADAPWLTWIISISSVIALFTTMLVITSINSWAVYAAAKDEILPKKLSVLNKNGQPFFAVIFIVLVSGIICLFPNFVNEIVNMGVLFNIITIFIVVISFLIARKKVKISEDSFRIKGGNFLPIFILAVMVMCNISNLITTNVFMVFVYTVVFIILGIAIFCVSKLRNK